MSAKKTKRRQPKPPPVPTPPINRWSLRVGSSYTRPHADCEQKILTWRWELYDRNEMVAKFYRQSLAKAVCDALNAIAETT